MFIKWSVKILIVVFLFILFGIGIYNFAVLKGNTSSTSSKIAPAANIDADLTSDWKTYTSPVFDYSFKYPTSWNILMFNESDTKVLYGSHSMHNYSITEVEKFMDHGLVDWTSFIKDKPAIKIDFAVYSKKPGPNQYQTLSSHIRMTIELFTFTYCSGILKVMSY